MNVSQLPSGSYRFRQTIEGKVYSVTSKHYPTDNELTELFKKEIIRQYNKQKKEEEEKKKLITFKDYAEEYIRLKDSVLSPGTIAGYKKIVRQLSDEFLKTKMDKISTIEVQREINKFSVNHAPKSVRNLHGFISAVIRLFYPQTIISTTLPQKRVYAPYIPSTEDVKRVLDYLKTNKPDYYLAIVMASLGLRRSELICLSSDDLYIDAEGKDVLKINKALVQGDDNAWRLKTTKTVSSTREIKIPHDIAELIRKQGVVFSGNINGINYQLTKAEEALGIPHFSLHKLRHFYVTIAHLSGISDVLIAATVGHADVSTTRKVYTHAQDPQVSSAQDIMNSILSSSIL